MKSDIRIGEASIEEKLKIQEKKKYYRILLKTYKTVLRETDVFFSDVLFCLLYSTTPQLHIQHNSPRPWPLLIQTCRLLDSKPRRAGQDWCRNLNINTHTSPITVHRFTLHYCCCTIIIIVVIIIIIIMVNG